MTWPWIKYIQRAPPAHQIIDSIEKPGLESHTPAVTNTTSQDLQACGQEYTKHRQNTPNKQQIWFTSYHSTSFPSIVVGGAPIFRESLRKDLNPRFFPFFPSKPSLEPVLPWGSRAHRSPWVRARVPLKKHVHVMADDGWWAATWSSLAYLESLKTSENIELARQIFNKKKYLKKMLWNCELSLASPTFTTKTLKSPNFSRCPLQPEPSDMPQMTHTQCQLLGLSWAWSQWEPGKLRGEIDEYHEC